MPSMLEPVMVQPRMIGEQPTMRMPLPCASSIVVVVISTFDDLPRYTSYMSVM